MADVCHKNAAAAASLKKNLKMVADLDSIVALPSRRLERATVISETSLESVEEEVEEEGDSEVFEDEGLVAYGDDLVYPTMLFKTNPFLVEEGRNVEICQAQQKSSPLSTRISDPNGEIAKLMLNRTAVKPGETIYGLLDFSNGNVTCTEYAVSLLAEIDVIAAAHNKAPQKLLTVSEVCLGLDSTFFEIYVPRKAVLTRSSPSSSQYLPPRWILRFEFVLTPKDFLTDCADKKRVTWKAPARVKVKTRRWDAPIEVLEN